MFEQEALAGGFATKRLWSTCAGLTGEALLLACAAGAAGPMSQGLPRAVMRWLLLAQVVFYAMAALGARAGRIGVLARTFVVLNAAAVVGLWRFATSRQKITW